MISFILSNNLKILLLLLNICRLELYIFFITKSLYENNLLLSAS